jgi:hypothetical protein
MGIGSLYRKIYLEPVFNPKLYRNPPLDKPRFGRAEFQSLTGNRYSSMAV